METKRVKQKIKTKKPVFIQKKNTIPRPICIQTAQKTVPIVGVHEKYGLIETYPGCYVKSYLIGDNNYLTAPEEEQNVYYRGWKKVLNSFGSNVEFALSFNNRSINMTDFFESVLIKETVHLDPTGGNTPTAIHNITEVYVNNQPLGLGGYLDIGLYDTMYDLIVNFIGAGLYSICAYFFLTSKSCSNLVGKLMMRRKKEGEDYLCQNVEEK